MRLSLLFARVCPCGLLEKLGWDRIAETPVTPAHARQHQGKAAPSSSSHVQEYVAFVPLAGNSAPYAGKSRDLLSFWRVPQACASSARAALAGSLQRDVPLRFGAWTRSRARMQTIDDVHGHEEEAESRLTPSLCQTSHRGVPWR